MVHVWGMRVAALLIAVASVALVAGCGSSGSPTATTGGSVSLPPEAGHVHGIVRTPAGTTVVGTHAGLYAAGPDGALTRVGDDADYMGLAVLPSGVLLSSGHPGPGTDEPDPLGLRRSADGGVTWTRVSSVPRDDYHVIDAGGGRIYAVGTDGALRSGTAPESLVVVGDAPPSLIDLAVNPRRGSALVASTQAGLTRSTDGGRTWASTTGPVGLMSWARPDALFVVDAAGEISLSRDGGTSWTSRGTIGAPPAALLAWSPNDLIAADHEGRFRTSPDGGRTWS